MREKTASFLKRLQELQKVPTVGMRLLLLPALHSGVTSHGVQMSRVSVVNCQFPFLVLHAAVPHASGIGSLCREEPGQYLHICYNRLSGKK